MAYQRHFQQTRLNQRTGKQGGDRGTDKSLRPVPPSSSRTTGDAVMASCAIMASCARHA